MGLCDYKQFLASTHIPSLFRVSSRISVKRGQTYIAIVKLKGGGENLIVFLGFVGEGILWYNSNYSNKGDLGVLSQENFEIYDI